MVQVENNKIDFLLIGVQKAATSWLWQNLYEHPDIYMPPRKELHYFDRSTVYPSPSYLAFPYLRHRLFGNKHHNKLFRRELFRGLGSAILSLRWHKLTWNLSYFLCTIDDDWYLSLFGKGKGKLKGESTPSYSILDLKDVRYISKLFPELKIVIILRNPIERAWSHIRFNRRLGLINDINDLGEIMKFIESPGQLKRSDYISMIGNWSSCFPKNQIYIGFYDDIVQDPWKFLFHILDFLCADTTKIPDAGTLKRKTNVSFDIEIPEEMKYHLAKMYHPQLLDLSHLIGGHSIKWLNDTEKILRDRQNLL